MGFDKYLGKDRRKPYYKSGRFDLTCRPHGSCPYCYNNRMFKQRRAKVYAEMEIKEWKEGKMEINNYD